jgi:hypothetical protein
VKALTWTERVILSIVGVSRDSDEKELVRKEQITFVVFLLCFYLFNNVLCLLGRV